MKPKIIIVFLVLFLACSTGCNKDILNLKNLSTYDATNYFTDGTTINQAVVACYATLLHSGMMTQNWYYIFDMLANDCEKTRNLVGDYLQFSNYSYTSNQSELSNLWIALYNMLLRANLVVDKASAWAPEADSDKNARVQYIAEGHFFKGFAEFFLVNGWGRVPLKPDYTSEQTYDAPRASVADSWAAVESDFNAAISGLPIVYPSEELGRATKGAAIAFLGKAYLYQQKYDSAVMTLLPLTQAPYTYSLNPSFSDQFSDDNATSPETIFDVMHEWTGWAEGNAYYYFGGVESWGGKTTHTGRAMEYGFNDWWNVVLSNAAVQAFTYPDEHGNTYVDPRAGLTFYGNAASGGDTTYCSQCSIGIQPYNFSEFGYSWKKYEHYEYIQSEGQPQSDINTQVIRYADVLLMLAESYIMQNQVSSALPLINQVRARVGAFQYTSLGSQSAAMTILQRERQMEFCGEQSRWFDLRRWGMTVQTLNAEKAPLYGPNVFPGRDTLFPIPDVEKLYNKEVASDIQDGWN